MVMVYTKLSERKWIDRGYRVLVHDSLEEVHIDAVAGVVCKGYYCI